MRIGLIVAIPEELAALKNFLDVAQESTIFDLQFYIGKIHDKECILVESGVGKVNAARTTQILIDNFGVDYLFNVGIAGGISDKLLLGDIIIGEKLVQHDFDITAFNHEKGYIPQIGTFINADTFLINLANEVLVNSKFNFERGVIASGDIFCTSLAMSQKINSKFSALCVEMEGASIAQVCYLSHIPFLVLRSISDIPNNHNTITYEKFAQLSSQKIAQVISMIIAKL